jgi:hypothetical protein
MEVLAVFEAVPEVTVLHGRAEIETVDPAPSIPQRSYLFYDS